MNVAGQDRRLPILGHPKADGEYLLKREKRLERASIHPSYALSLDISVFETDPVAEASIETLYDTAISYKEKTLKGLGI